MTSASPLCPTLPLKRQHLVAFTERYYGGTLQAIRLHPLHGGIQTAGVFRVQAQLRRPTGCLHPVQFVVKLAHGELRRECAVYRTLEVQRAEALAPRLLDVMHVGATALLFLEWVQPVSAWPWRDVHAAAQVLVRLARLHQWPWGRRRRRWSRGRTTTPCTSLGRPRWRPSSASSASRGPRRGRQPCR